MKFFNSQNYTLIGATLLTAVTGYLTGRIIDTHIAMASVPPLAVVPDTRPRVPVVHIDGIRNGFIEGTMNSGARLIIGDTYVIPTKSADDTDPSSERHPEHVSLSGVEGRGVKGEMRFSIPAASFLVDHVAVEVPAGMRFVASKSGKKYYPVDSAAGSRLKPENRVYFATEEEARGAGFVE